MHGRPHSFRARALLACVPAVGMVVMATAGTASASHAPALNSATVRTEVEHLLRSFHPTNEGLGRVGLKQLGSTNWSGYVDTSTKAGAYTSLSGSWTEPKISGCKANTVSAAVFWVGIDGISSSDPTVEQDGTIAICPGGGSTTPEYGSWWEMYPKNDVQIVGGTVKPGDKITASVVRSGTKYTLKVTDSTTSGNSFSKKQTCSASTCKNESAEWIAERPGLSTGLSTLPNFGTWTASSAKVTGGGKSGTISSFSDDEVTMFNKPGGHVLAQPGALNSAGNSFKDVWKASS
jgi:hypothetical protein